MKMTLDDICPGRKLGAPVLRVLQLSKAKDVDPTAELYRKVRDAAMFVENVPAATRIAVLELVKSEIVRNLQAEIGEAG